MEFRKVYLFALFCFVLSSCHRQYTNTPILLRADALLNSKPDSAQKLLLSILHPQKLSKADYAAWCLLYTHSQYKLYQNIRSDSIIRVAVKYYDNSNLYKQSGSAHYLSGCVFQLKNNNKAAMLEYKKADDAFKNTTENDLIGLVKFKIGYIFMQDEFYSQSIIFFKKSLKYFIRSNNIKYQAYAYREISDMYVRLNYPVKSIMFYSNKALRLSIQSGDSLNYYSILAQQGELLLNSDYSLSKDYLLKGYQHFPSLRPNYATLIALDYTMLSKFDSAKFYLQISFADTLELKYRIRKYLAGAYVAKNEGNQKLAFDYVIRAYNDRDSVFNQIMRSQLYKIDKQYDLTQKEKENAELKIANRNNIILITMLVIGVLILLIIALLINSRYKKRQAEHAFEKQLIEYELKAKNKLNEQKRELLMSKLQNRIENTLHFNRLKTGLLKHEKQDAFMDEITKQSVISEKEWEYYIDELNRLFDGKLISLSDRYEDLSQSDLIVIALIYLKVDITDCCSLLDMTINTMYVRRKRIKKHIGIDKEIDLLKWVIQYFDLKPSFE